MMKTYEDAFVFKKLEIHPDERGFLMEILRNDDEIYKKFGQVYFTCCEPGFVKAWHYHKIKTDYFTCIHGTARVVVYDDREGSPTKGTTKEYILNRDNPQLVKIPTGCYHGFEAVGKENAYILSITTEPYHPEDTDEFRIPFDDPKIGFNWEGTKGF